MSDILVVDDLRRFDKNVVNVPITYARNSSDALVLLEKNKKKGFSQVWLDHDLGEDDDIRPVVQWLIENRPPIGHVFVQSMNPVGVDFIIRSLSPYYRVDRVNNPNLRVPDELI